MWVQFDGELSFHDISHLSVSDSLRQWRYINLLTYLLTCLLTTTTIIIVIIISTILVVLLHLQLLLCPAPYVTAYALMAVLCLSVCLSVCLSLCLSGCPVPDPKSRTEWRRQLNIVKKYMTRVTCDPI